MARSPVHAGMVAAGHQEKIIGATGWYARILQHEIDHLQGNLYIDRMQRRTFTSLDNWNRFYKSKPIRAVGDALR